MATTTEAMSAAQLAALVECSAARADALLFTATPREDLEEIGSWQRLSDLAFAGQCRAIVATHNRAGAADRQFVPDEVALAINAGIATGISLTVVALESAALPGLLEAVEAGVLTERHVRAVLRELSTVELSPEQRAAAVLVLLARYDDHTPGELVRVLRRVVLMIDLPAARRREKVATAGRRVRISSLPDGQASVWAQGPLAMVAAVKACLDTMLQGPAEEGDERPHDARMFDLFIDLLTGGSDGPGRFEVQVLVPVSTAIGGDLELAEVPGFGPLLPSTARDLLDTCDALRRVAVDSTTGEVVAVDDSQPTDRRAAGAAADRPRPAEPLSATQTPTAERATSQPLTSQPLIPQALTPQPLTPQPAGEPTLGTQVSASRRHRLRAALDRMLTDPVLPAELSSPHYRPGSRVLRHLQARDRTCQFPGCGQTRTDADHRIPWPRGQTTLDNLACLCRRHHRAKHTSFTLGRDDDGTLWWTTRGGQVHPRRHRPY